MVAIRGFSSYALHGVGSTSGRYFPTPLMPDREATAAILDEIALLMELKGENPFKTRAYKTGAEIVRTHPGDIMKLAVEDDLKGIKGIGDALAQKLNEIATTEKLEFHENLRAEFPEGLFDLFEIQGLGAKKIRALHNKLDVGSIADLKAVCEDGRVAELSGFGKKTAEKVLEAIAYRESNAGRFRQNEVAASVEEIQAFLRSHPNVARVSVAGSYRRGKETLHDLDFIVATKKPQAVLDAFVSADFVEKIVVHGKTKASVHLKDQGIPADLRAVDNDSFPFALQYFTGSKEHNVALRSRALKQGFTLNEYRLAPTDEDAAPLQTLPDEDAIYKRLGLPHIDPALRENTGEMEAAEADELPDLIQLENLRGTFHNHTTASDGKASLAEMAAAAEELGLQYLGIADHSKASFQANGLDEARLEKQVEEIAALNAEFDGFRLFSGTECDILKDGSLDFSDATLSGLDYVVASVHNAFTLSEKDMTARIIKAIENPYVTMLGHLTGRLLLKREPYAVDVPAVIEAAAENGTIIELNANPWRLDMDWRWWKLAKEKGVKTSINPDAHDPEGLQYLYYGVRAARKGWLERSDVINCLPLGEIEGALARKRP